MLYLHKSSLLDFQWHLASGIWYHYDLLQDVFDNSLCIWNTVQFIPVEMGIYKSQICLVLRSLLQNTFLCLFSRPETAVYFVAWLHVVWLHPAVASDRRRGVWGQRAGARDCPRPALHAAPHSHLVAVPKEVGIKWAQHKIYMMWWNHSDLWGITKFWLFWGEFCALFHCTQYDDWEPWDPLVGIYIRGKLTNSTNTEDAFCFDILYEWWLERLISALVINAFCHYNESPRHCLQRVCVAVGESVKELGQSALLSPACLIKQIFWQNEPDIYTHVHENQASASLLKAFLVLFVYKCEY